MVDNVIILRKKSGDVKAEKMNAGIIKIPALFQTGVLMESRSTFFDGTIVATACLYTI